jgi:16S rRNA U516 pseudouridylate synthase RsuA-like enzyme
MREATKPATPAKNHIMTNRNTYKNHIPAKNPPVFAEATTVGLDETGTGLLVLTTNGAGAELDISIYNI